MARGTLRIYLGAAPGVGKTCAMLGEGHRRQDRQTDVVVAYVETHGRRNTARLVDGLEMVPRRVLAHRGSSLEEMDVDAVLARRPEVALVDELAHTNAPGSRNEKRWQDIDELLAAGIDVISTVNIQHLESLNDAVAHITGVRQQETVPDDIVRAADQIELVDMSPEALRRRMAHGNIYDAHKVDAALRNWFREGNLSALRELALLWLADRVDEGLAKYRDAQGITGTWATRERVLVALTGGAEGEQLLRRGARIAGRGAGGELCAVYVSRADGLVGAHLDNLARLRRLTGELGGTFHLVSGEDIPTAILDVARGVNASQIVIGDSRTPRWLRGIRSSVRDEVISRSGDIDVHVVSHPQAAARRFPRRHAGRDLGGRRTAWGWLLATLGLATLLASLVLTREQHALALDTLLLLALVVVTATVGGIWPALFCAVAGSLALNWFLTPPLGTFTIADGQNAMSLVVFVLVAVLVASLVHVNARRAVQARAAQEESEALTQLSHALLGSADQLRLLLQHAVELLHVDGAAIVHTADAAPRRRAPGASDIVMITPGTSADEVRASTVVTDIDGQSQLVLCGGPMPAARQPLLAAIVAHAHAILSREDLAAQAAQASALARDNRARGALLSAVSHDLRTPLAGIKAGVSSLRATDVTWSPQDEEELLESVEECADRLDVLIGNLLDMSRLSTGTLTAHAQRLNAVEALVATVSRSSDPSRVTVQVDDNGVHLTADAGLLDRVVDNLVENALRHTARTDVHEQLVTVRADQLADRVQIRVVDRGPGVPESDQQRIFEPFQRRDDVPLGDGVGLGLAVARGLTELMDGSLAAEDTPGGGLTMVIDLPAARRHDQVQEVS